ncbi:MAG: helix-turn-helix transcriptional regulator [Pseudomonadota bacterium]|nr:helix-turn-helix transcriptional regulator [Pseudomonadota bacterium]
MEFSLILSDEAVLQELGRRLAQYRLNLNLTQQALAREAGISLRTLNRIECGEPSQTANVVRVLRALGLLGNVEALVPEAPASPIQQLKLKGRARKRASSARRATQAAEPWSWNTPEAEAAQGGGPDSGQDSGQGAA